MKAKLLYLMMIGLLFTACSVDPIDEEINFHEVQEVNSVTNDDGCAGPDNSMTISLSAAEAIPSWDEARKLYLSLLSSGVSRDGEFDPSIWDIINKFQDLGLGDYTTYYSLDGDCNDSVRLTITVVPDELQVPNCNGVNAGPDNSIEIQLSEAAAIKSWDEVRKLYLNLLASVVSREGEFDPSIWNLINAFNDADNPIGAYSTTYTITEGECSDSVLLTVNVIADEQQQPICDGVDAGPNNLIEMSVSEAAALPSWDEVRKLYLSLLADGVSHNGVFDPSIWNLIDAFNATEDPVGDYTTTYTIIDGDCTDSVELTIRVVPD
ncbi:MAG: hypothetical protein R3353_00495 [Salegentibacter mishustinae]|nr:hypothetical protein [Salegentibacter mishustinae]